MSLSDRPALRVTATPAKGARRFDPGRNRLSRLLSGWVAHAVPASAPPRPLPAGETAPAGCRLLDGLVPLPMHLLRGVWALPSTAARGFRRPNGRSHWSRAICLEVDSERLLGELDRETERVLLESPVGHVSRSAERLTAIGH